MFDVIRRRDAEMKTAEYRVQLRYARHRHGRLDRVDQPAMAAG
jgi:hypothetical protein